MEKLIAFVASLTLLSGCASQPADNTSSAPAAPVPAATTPTTAAPATAAPATGAAAQSAAVNPYPGYKAKQKGGTTVYCKKIAKVGTNFAQETCMTEAEMKQLAERTEQDREAFRRNQTLCGTGGCGGS